jgi:hypothetical protein
MNVFKGLFYTLVGSLGIFIVIVFGGLAIQPALDALDSLASAASQPLSSEAQEFLAIEPRTEWPEVMAEVDEDRLYTKFIEGVNETNPDQPLTNEQLWTVRLEIIPRLKELMTRSVEKAQAEYWFWYWRPVVIRDAMARDQAENWGPKYRAAISEIVNR